MYKLEKSPICKVQQIGDLHFLKLHKNQIRQYLMGTVSVLKTDIKKCDSTALTTYFYIVRAVLSLKFETIYRKNTK